MSKYRETLPFLYQISIEGIRDIIRECWAIYQNESNDKSINMYQKISALKLALAIAKKPTGHGDKKTRDNNGSGNGNGNTVTIEECKNRGSASGFDTATNQECENLICTHPGENATCVQEGAAAVNNAVNKTAPIDPCLTCFTQNLNSDEQAAFIQAIVKLGFRISSIEDICKIINQVSELQIELILRVLAAGGDISEGHARALFDCLQQAGLISGDARLTIQK